MRTHIVLTLTGTDRVGLVEDVTRLLLARGGNVETSRMARLGGEFAMLMFVSMPRNQRPGLETDLEALAAQGFKVTTSETEPTLAAAHPSWTPYEIEVQGADHEGIIHQVAHHLAQSGITIESMDTETSQAPISGLPLFAMTALVAVPPGLAGQDWASALEKLGRSLNVDIKVSAAPGR